MKSFLLKLKLSLREMWVLLSIIAVLFIGMTFASPYFLKTDNIMNIIQNISTQGITAIGMTIVIIAGGIDLSVGGVLCLSAWICASLIKSGVPWGYGVLVAFAVAIIWGLVNAFAIAIIGVPPMIATLATMYMSRGLQVVISGAKTLTGFPEAFQFIGNGYLFKVIPMPAFLTVVLFILGALFMNRTILGRNVYAVGGNKEAARVAGINTTGVIIFTYIISAVLSCCAGLIFVARTNSAPSTLGNQIEMKAIMGAVIGGTSVTFGGKGTIMGTFIGVLIVGLIINAMDLLGLSSYWQQFVQGTCVLIAVTFETLRSKIAIKK